MYHHTIADGSYVECAKQLAKELYRLHNWNKPQAPGIVGKATRYSRDGAKEWAIKDFVDRAIAARQIKADDVKC
ncbi:hypothetical protein I4U23_003555 [Adineta vaga]|nr:hypothetical protein I4U23_003555 [Adineta vaga]